MREMTKANLEAAFAGESQAHMKYAIFADKAEREGYPETRAVVPGNLLCRASSRHQPPAGIERHR